MLVLPLKDSAPPQVSDGEERQDDCEYESTIGNGTRNGQADNHYEHDQGDVNVLLGNLIHLDSFPGVNPIKQNPMVVVSCPCRLSSQPLESPK